MRADGSHEVGVYRRIHVIINPAAGQDRPVLAILNRAFHERDVDWDVFVTKRAGDARRYAEQAVAAGVDAVAVYGGDGTVREVADGLIGTDMPLAIFPGGTANVISTELGIPSDLAEACALVRDDISAIRAIDVGEIGDQHFLIRVGLGFEAQMIEGADRDLKDKLGRLAYAVSALQALRESRTARYQLRLDGRELECEGITCMIANAGSVGTTGVTIAPTIDVSDGLLDVVVVPRADPGSLLTVATSIVTGAEPADALQHWQAREVQVEADPPQTVQVDGEVLGAVPVQVRVLPQAVRVVVPTSSLVRPDLPLLP